MLYPQNGERMVAIDSVTSLHAMYCIVCRTSATHRLGLHDVVEESFEKLKNGASSNDNSRIPREHFASLFVHNNSSYTHACIRQQLDIPKRTWNKLHSIYGLINFFVQKTADKIRFELLHV